MKDFYRDIFAFLMFLAMAALLIGLTAYRVFAAPSYATITGTVVRGSGAVCAGCNVTFRVPYAQPIGGQTIAAGIALNFALDANGAVPSGKEIAQTLIVEVSIDKNPPVLTTIPSSASVNLSSLVTEPIALPANTSLNSLDGVLSLEKGGTNNTTWTASRCVQTSSDGSKLESASAACGSGGGGGDSITVNSSAATDPDFLNGDIDWTLSGGNSITATVACTGCVDATDLAADSVDSSEIAADAVGTSEIATDGVGSAEIAADAVGTSEIATDGVGNAEIADSAVQASEIATGAVGTSEIADGVVAYSDANSTATLAGDPAFGASSVWLATTGLIWEGATSNASEGLLIAADVTADRTWTLPNETGTICTTGSVCTGYQAAGTYPDITGTPANNQIAVWTDANTLEGVSNLTWDGTTVLEFGDGVVGAAALSSNISLNDPSLEFTTDGVDGFVDCVNCRFSMAGGTLSVPDGNGASNSVAYWGDSDSLTDDTTDFSYNSATNTLTVANLSGNATTATTAGAGDSADSFFSSGDIERARGGTNADTSAYGNGLLGSDGSNNTIDVDTIAELETAIGGTDIMTSTEVSASYLPLAGGTMSGGILLNSSVTGSTGSSFDLLDFSNTFDMTAGAPQTINGLDFSPTATMSTAGNPELNAVKFGGSVAVSTTVPFVHGLYFTPTVSYSNTTDPFPVYRVSAATCSPTFTSSSANATLYQDCFADLTTVNYSGATDVTADVSTGNPWAPWTLLSSQIFKTSGAGDLTIGRGGSSRFQPTFDAETAGSVLTFTDLVGYDAVTPACTGDNCGSGSATATNYSVVWGDFSTALDSAYTIGTAYGLRLTDFTKGTTANYSLHSNGNTTLYNGGVVDLGDAIADITTTSTTNVIDVSPQLAMSGLAGRLNVIYSAPDITSASNLNILSGFAFEPTMTSSSSSTVNAFSVAGTYTQTASSSTYNQFNITPTYTSSTAAIAPILNATSVSIRPTISSTATSGTATPSNYIGAAHGVTVTQNGAGGTMTLANDIGFQAGATYNETAGTLNITTRTGFKFNEYTAGGTPQVTTQVGLDIAALSGATTNIGIRNADTTAFTPNAQTSLGASFTIDPTATFIRVASSGAASITSSATCITDGQDGQIVTILSVEAGADTITFTDGTNCFFDGSANKALGATDTVTMIFDATAGVWYQISASDN